MDLGLAEEARRFVELAKAEPDEAKEEASQNRATVMKASLEPEATPERLGLVWGPIAIHSHLGDIRGQPLGRRAQWRRRWRHPGGVGGFGRGREQWWATNRGSALARGQCPRPGGSDPGPAALPPQELST